MSNLQIEIIGEMVRTIVEEIRPWEKPLSKPERDTLTRKHQWMPPDAEIATRALNRMVFGSAALLGYKQIDMPAEYIAAIIISCVWPTNWYKAAHMMTDVVTQEAAVAAGYEDCRIPVNTTKLYSLIWLARCHFDRTEAAIASAFEEAELVTIEDNSDAKTKYA